MNRLGGFLAISALTLLTRGSANLFRSQLGRFGNSDNVVWISHGSVALALLGAATAIAGTSLLLRVWSGQPLRSGAKLAGVLLAAGVVLGVGAIPVTRAYAAARSFRPCSALDRTHDAAGEDGATTAYARSDSKVMCDVAE